MIWFYVTSGIIRKLTLFVSGKELIFKKDDYLEKFTRKQNSPLKQRFKIYPNLKLPTEKIKKISHTNLPLTEKNAPKYKNVSPKYPELEHRFFMVEFNTHFSGPPTLEIIRWGGAKKTIWPLPPPLTKCLVARLAEPTRSSQVYQAHLLFPQPTPALAFQHPIPV